MLPRATNFFVGFLCCFLAPSLSARAVVVVDGDNAYQQAVKRCLDEFLEAGGNFAEIVKRLQAPSPARNNTIRNTPINPATGANAIHDNDTESQPGSGEIGANGAAGAGSDTTVHWNPADNIPFGPPNNEPRDPCVSLMHELSHADEANRGVLDSGPYVDADGHWGISVTQEHAINTENELRKKKGLPQRKHDGRQAVPPRAVH